MMIVRLFNVSIEVDASPKNPRKLFRNMDKANVTTIRVAETDAMIVLIINLPLLIAVFK